MQVKVLFFAAVGISNVLASPLNIRAPEKNKAGGLLAREGDDLCCYPDIEDLKACHECRPFEEADSSTLTNSYPEEAVTKRAKDGIPPLQGSSTYLPLYPLPLITAMVGTSSHTKSQSDPTSTSASTLSSNTGLAPCTKDGNLIPAKPLLEPWCSTANEHFQCQFCSHTMPLSVVPDGAVDEHFAKQDFEIWTIEKAVDNITMIIKEDSDIHSRNDPCCIHGGIPEYNCDYCKGDADPPSTPHRGTAPMPSVTTPLSQPPKRSLKDICCHFNGVQTCYFCADGQKPPKGTEVDVSFWTQERALTGDLYRYEKVQDGKGADITETKEYPSSTQGPSAPITRPVQERNQNDLCCSTDGLQASTCYLCNKPLLADVTSNISVWTRKQEIGGDTYEYEMAPDDTSSPTNDLIQNKCCSWIGYIPICFDCPSATSATGVSLPPAIGNKLVARDSNDLCCFTNGLQVFNCYLCNKTPTANINVADGSISVWRQGSQIGKGTFEYDKLKDMESSPSRDSDKKCCSIPNNQQPVCYECPTAGNTPTPTLSFPVTEANTPQITPRVTVTLGRRSEQKKCYRRLSPVAACHNCSSEEEDAFDHAPILPTTAIQKVCCIHHDEGFVCHDCPTGMANPTEYVKQNWAPSVAPRQTTYEFHITCNGIYDIMGATKLKCPNGKGTISGATCQSACHCDDLGGMHCDGPAGCTNDAMTKFCRLGSAYWGCACTHLPDHPPALENTTPH